MNFWTQLSIDFANQRNYLDKLFQVYPTIPNDIRQINQEIWKNIEISFEARQNKQLIIELLRMELFPIKDSYVAYLRQDLSALDRNPETVNRLASTLYDMGLDKILEKCTQPKETNRQIGPMFQNWLKKKDRNGNSVHIGVPVLEVDKFLNYQGNCILDASDASLKNFAQNYLNYNAEKGLDLIAKFNNQFVIGEAKFLTDLGGHQNAQLNDALALVNNNEVNAVTVAILDGVIYIPAKRKNKETKMSSALQNKDKNIMSALVLKEFLYSL